MLYIVASNYYKGWYHNYITNKMDDAKKHYFFFVIKEGEEGICHLKMDHFDNRMYPYLAKNEKIMSHYVLFKWNLIKKKWEKVCEDFGSDWIGFQEEEFQCEVGLYKV